MSTDVTAAVEIQTSPETVPWPTGLDPEPYRQAAADPEWCRAWAIACLREWGFQEGSDGLWRDLDELDLDPYSSDEMAAELAVGMRQLATHGPRVMRAFDVAQARDLNPVLASSRTVAYGDSSELLTLRCPLPHDVGEATASIGEITEDLTDFRLIAHCRAGGGGVVHTTDEILAALDVSMPGLDAGQELDWDRAFAGDHEEAPDWLVPDVMARGELVTLFGASGGRKSLLSLFWTLQVVRGGEHVLYLDRENRRGEVVRRLRAMGATPDQLQLLHYRWLPDWLVDDQGGQERILRAANGMALVVFDSWARFFAAGNQSDDGPANAAYNGLLLPLRGRNVGALRIDHSGHRDSTRPSGTIVKQADADHLWMVNTRGERTTLTHTKNRTGRSGPDVLVLEWKEGPLRVETPAVVTAPDESESSARGGDRVAECVAAMDALSLDTTWGRGRVMTALQANGHRYRNETVSEAIATRRSGQG